MNSQKPAHTPLEHFPKRSHYPGLDGLRGIAIILVLLVHHFGNYLLPSWGWIGVDLFFVLSGFLITDILLHANTQFSTIRNFYIRRALRILPLYYLSLILLFHVLPFLGISIPGLSYNKEQEGLFWLYLQNFFFATHIPAGDEISMTHFWSLAVEEQFYLVWPIILFTLRKNTKIMTGLMLSVLVLNLVRTGLMIRYDNLIHPLSFEFTRIDGILIGSILAFRRSFPDHWKKLKVLTWVTGISVSLLMTFVFFRFTDHRVNMLAAGGFTFIALLLGWLVNWNLDNKSNLIQSRMPRFFGKYSYGIYIFHWPIIISLHPYTESWLWPIFHHRLPESLFLIAVEIGVAIFIYHVFEKHFLRLKRYF